MPAPAVDSPRFGDTAPELPPELRPHQRNSTAPADVPSILPPILPSILPSYCPRYCPAFAPRRARRRILYFVRRRNSYTPSVLRTSKISVCGSYREQKCARASKRREAGRVARRAWAPLDLRSFHRPRRAPRSRYRRRASRRPFRPSRAARTTGRRLCVAPITADVPRTRLPNACRARSTCTRFSAPDVPHDRSCAIAAVPCATPSGRHAPHGQPTPDQRLCLGDLQRGGLKMEIHVPKMETVN